MKNSPILVIGKNGKTASRVNQRLGNLGYSTRGVSRSTTPSFDWNDEDNWADVIAHSKWLTVMYLDESMKHFDQLDSEYHSA